MEEAFFDVPWCCEFAQLDFNGHMLKKNTIFKFCNRLVKGKLADAILATVIDLLDAQYFPCGSGRAGHGSLAGRCAVCSDCTVLLVSQVRCRFPDIY